MDGMGKITQQFSTTQPFGKALEVYTWRHNRGGGESVSQWSCLVDDGDEPSAPGGIYLDPRISAPKYPLQKVFFFWALIGKVSFPLVVGGSSPSSPVFCNVEFLVRLTDRPQVWRFRMGDTREIYADIFTTFSYPNVGEWGFPKIGVPQNGWFIMEHPI